VDINKKLKEFFGLAKEVKSIDCFDVSHFQSIAIVGSCIRFTNGVVDKSGFRKFKIKDLYRQNDYAALQEVVLRRYKNGDFPDLVLIDGGKGQRSAVVSLLAGVHCISLAKKEETVFSQNFPQGKKLDIQHDIGKLLISLRDYAHHFAINYHRNRRRNNFRNKIERNL